MRDSFRSSCDAASKRAICRAGFGFWPAISAARMRRTCGVRHGYVSEAMGELCALAAEAARTDLPVLIQGEAGAGKQRLARAIHAHSARRAAPFLVQKCGGLDDAQQFAELFGAGPDEPAAARAHQAGLLRAAEGGTVFLSEISEIAPAVQTHLLRFLEREAAAPPPGSDHAAPARVIAASTRPLKSLVTKGDFRCELYMRLRAFELDVPALRDRADDIPVLAELFIAKHSAAARRRILGISANALAKLVAYDFPGNVSELEGEIRRMVALAKDNEYLTSRLLSAAISEASRRAGKPENGFAPAGATLKDKVENLERHILREALLQHKWNRSRVAELLGLSRVGLANKIRRYRLNEQR
jgi:two-component system response regulator HupR/HoxA